MSFHVKGSSELSYHCI